MVKSELWIGFLKPAPSAPDCCLFLGESPPQKKSSGTAHKDKTPVEYLIIVQKMGQSDGRVKNDQLIVLYQPIK
jgi:hypothetical protein